MVLKVKSDKPRPEARTLVMPHPFVCTAVATVAETAALKVAMFEAVFSADQWRFSPLSRTGLWDKLGFSAASVHHTQQPLFILFIKNLCRR